MTEEETPLPDDPFEELEEPADPGEPVDLLGGLFDGSQPGPSVPEIENDYGLNRGWSIALRGCTRVVGAGGIPPIFEILFGGSLGILEFWRGRESDPEPVGQLQPINDDNAG